MADENVTSQETFKTHCFNCDKETNQDILFKDQEIGPREIIWRNEQGDESQSVWEVVATIWSLSKCRGCEKINFKHIVRNSPERETDQVFHFPRKPIRQVPNWVIKLPMKYVEILQEVYISINERLFILSLTGIRTLLDIYIVDIIGDAGTFKQKLNKLVSDGIITTSKATVLETAIDAGNASAHRGYKPDKETLFQILDIVENLLQSEIVDRNATHIKQKTPQRK
ncbi:MAG: DUF4145 domain-containing protein [Pedobacter sp.]|nr:MAG: DUF4145 domain-containing protein [Pedobacter sp.]